MRIGILGAGKIDATAGRLLARAGHEVALSNSRGPDSLTATIAELNRDAGAPRVHAATIDDAAGFGEVVLLAVPWRAPEALPSPERVRGKIVIDAMNPYAPDFSLIDLEERRAIPLEGDDAEAKAVVMRLMEEMGFAPVDTGGLREGGRRQQPGTALYNRDLTRRDALALLG